MSGMELSEELIRHQVAVKSKLLMISLVPLMV